MNAVCVPLLLTLDRLTSVVQEKIREDDGMVLFRHRERYPSASLAGWAL